MYPIGSIMGGLRFRVGGAHGAIGTLVSRALCSSSIRFIYNAENEAPLFYENRIGRYGHEEDYNVPFEKTCREIFKGAEGTSLEYHLMDPLVCMAAVQSIGRMPVNRELAACTIPKLFFQERKAYKIRKWRGQDFFYHDVLLRPRYLQHQLLKEAFAKNEGGVVTRTRYNRLKATLDAAVIKHAVEVDLEGCRFVIFLSREEMSKKSSIAKELAKVDISVAELKLKMWRPEDVSNISQWVTEETKRRMDERLQMTHCHTRHISEVVDDDPVRLVPYFEDYNDSEFKSKERKNLSLKSRIVHSQRR